MANEFKVKNGLIVDAGGIQVTGSIVGQNGITGSIAATNNVISGSSQIALLGYAITGSNIFTGSQTITGSVNITGSLTASLQQGYAWVGGAGNISRLVATSSFGGTSGFLTTDYDFNTTDSPIIPTGSITFIQDSGSTYQVIPNVSGVNFKYLNTTLIGFVNSQSVYFTTPFTASLQQGYAWVGGVGNVSTLVSTSSFGSPINISSLNTYTGSNDTTNTAQNSRLTNLETTSASVNISISSLNSFSASENTKASTLATYTGSIDTKFTAVAASTASLNTFTASNAIASLNTYTGSNSDVKFASIGASTASLNAFTASNGISQLNTFTASNFTSQLNLFTSSAALRLSNLETTSASVNISVTNLNTYSASVSNSILNLNSLTSSLVTTYEGRASATKTLFSGSSQVTFTQLSGISAGIVSSSAQIVPLLPTGVVSGSSQVLGGTGIISSSTQLNNTTITNLSVTNLTVVNETASVLFSSGSNRFGDFGDDVHDFTGSVKISGSFNLIGSSTATSYNGIHNGTINSTNGVVSGSSQITLSSTTGYSSVLNQAVLTSSLPTFAGGSMTGNLSFSQPVGVTFANGQYIKDNSNGGLSIYSGAAINLNGTSTTITGNISLGATNTSYVGPAQYGGIMFPRGNILFSNTNGQNQMYMVSNAYLNSGSTWSYRTASQYAGYMAIDNGAFSVALAGNSGAADSVVTFTTPISITNAGVTTFGGNVIPDGNGTRDLGSTSYRWSTVYTSDLSLNNGIGDWTIVEGEDDLFLYNNKKGKVYKFALTEVDPNVATPKKS